jgi:hypothetical protein
MWTPNAGYWRNRGGQRPSNHPASVNFGTGVCISFHGQSPATFGAQVRRVLTQRSLANAQTGWWKKILARVGWLWAVLAGFLWLIVGLLVSVLVIAAFVILLLAVLLPIQPLKEALLNLQLKIASTLGDSYMLVSHTSDASSMVGKVLNDGKWLAGRCKIVVVVAHSQGGALAHKALQKEIPPNLRVLFTFGSGLKKLEQLEDIIRPSGDTYLRSAFLTLMVMLSFFLLLVLSVLEVMKQSPSYAAIGIMLILACLALAYLVAGIRDHVREINLPRLKRWIKDLKETPVEWMDCFATADPVSNGLLFDELTVKNSSKEVSNLSSILRDHTSYWANRDQFVTLLIEQLTQPKLRKEAALPPAPELAMGQQNPDWIGIRRRWRLSILSAIKRVAILSVLLAIYREFQFWWSVLSYLSLQIQALMSPIRGKSEPAIGFTVSWPALITLALVLLAYGIARCLWQFWNDAEMRALVEGRISAVKSAEENFYLLAIWVVLVVQLLIDAWVLYRGVPAPLIILLVLSVFLITVTEPRPSTPGNGKPSETGASPGEPISLSDQLSISLRPVVAKLVVSWGCGAAAWEGVVWLVKQFFGGSILGFRPSEAVGLFVAAIALAFIFGRRAWVRVRNRCSLER